MSNPGRTIVVGVAGMDDQDPRTPGGADPVLGPAVALAAALGAQLHAVHAFEIPGELAWLPPRGQEHRAPPGGGRAYVRQLEDRLERQLASIPGGDAAHCRAVEGSAAEVLCRTAEEVEADLLVVGASRRGRAWSGILGSTASQVIAASAIPVLIVHRPFARHPGRVLLTSDLSASGWDAVRRGMEAARLVTGGASEVRCLHVVDLDPLIAPPVADDVLEAVAGARLDRGLRDAGFGPALAERRVRVGDAAREITREALEWGADLVVAGTDTRPELDRRRVGHVATAVARGASCNVLLIPVCAAGPVVDGARTAAWRHGGGRQRRRPGGRVRGAPRGARRPRVSSNSRHGPAGCRTGPRSAEPTFRQERRASARRPGTTRGGGAPWTRMAIAAKRAAWPARAAHPRAGAGCWRGRRPW